jgi:hypothetical protein
MSARDGFRPTVVDPKSALLADNYGIAPERAKELEQRMDAEMAVFYRQGLVQIWQVVDKIAELVETKEEFAWAYCSHMMWLAAKGGLLNQNPRDLLKRRPPPPQN